jgi:hypothetical protein
MNRIPALSLPLQQSVYNDLSSMYPIVDATGVNYEKDLVGATIHTTLASNVLSEKHYEEVSEAVHASEKKRAMELEQDELNMSADELRQVLKGERLRTTKIQTDLQITTLRYNELLSYHHQQQQQHHNDRLVKESLGTDTVQKELLLRRQKRKHETVETSSKNSNHVE